MIQGVYNHALLNTDINSKGVVKLGFFNCDDDLLFPLQ